MKTKQDSRMYFESLVFYYKTIQYVIKHQYHFFGIAFLLNFLIPYQEVESYSK